MCGEQIARLLRVIHTPHYAMLSGERCKSDVIRGIHRHVVLLLIDDVISAITPNDAMRVDSARLGRRARVAEKSGARYARSCSHYSAEALRYKMLRARS